MRSSDWSSDVCSSDLSAAEPVSVFPNETDQPTLNLDPIRAEDAGLERLVRRFQRNRVALPAQPLQGYLDIVDQCHDDGAVLGAVAALDDYRFAIYDAGIDHRIVIGRSHVFTPVTNS